MRTFGSVVLSAVPLTISLTISLMVSLMIQPVYAQGYFIPVPFLPVPNLFSFGSGALSGRENSPEYAQSVARNKAIKSFNKAYHFCKANNYQAAADCYRQALTEDPTLSEAHVGLGSALLKAQMYEQALPELVLGVRRLPNDENAWILLADCCTHLQKHDYGFVAYERYLQLDPSGPFAKQANEAIFILQHTVFPSSASDVSGSYLSDFADKGLRKWNTNLLPLRVYVFSNPNVPGFDPLFEPILRQSFNEWTLLSDGRIQFAYVDEPSKAQITCRWTADKKDLGEGQELGVTETQVNARGEIIHADIALLTVYDGKEGRRDEIDRRCKVVDLHEIGHALGLNHSHEIYDIMYPQVAPLGLEHPLTCRDKNTLLALYSSGASSALINQSFATFHRSISAAGLNLTDQLAKLNREAAQANSAHNFDLAIEKLESARQLSPSDQVILKNLGLACQNAAIVSEQNGNCLKAAQYYEQATGVLKNSVDHDAYIDVLNNYQAMLKRQTLQAAR